MDRPPPRSNHGPGRVGPIISPRLKMLLNPVYSHTHSLICMSHAVPIVAVICTGKCQSWQLFTHQNNNIDKQRNKATLPLDPKKRNHHTQPNGVSHTKYLQKTQSACPTQWRFINPFPVLFLKFNWHTKPNSTNPFPVLFLKRNWHT